MPRILMFHLLLNVSLHKFSNCKIKCKKKSYFERLSFWFDPSQQTITYSKLATEWTARTMRENSSKLRMGTLKQRQLCYSGVFIFNCKHISYFFLATAFEEAKFSWVHIEKTKTFQGKSGCNMRYLIPSQPYG